MPRMFELPIAAAIIAVLTLIFVFQLKDTAVATADTCRQVDGYLATYNQRFEELEQTASVTTEADCDEFEVRLANLTGMTVDELRKEAERLSDAQLERLSRALVRLQAAAHAQSDLTVADATTILENAPADVVAEFETTINSIIGDLADLTFDELVAVLEVLTEEFERQ